MKDFLSFRMKNIGPFNISSKETGQLLINQTRNLQIFVSKIFRHSKGLAPNVFANILSRMPLKKFGPHYQFGFQLNPSKIGI